MLFTEDQPWDMLPTLGSPALFFHQAGSLGRHMLEGEWLIFLS